MTAEFNAFGPDNSEPCARCPIFNENIVEEPEDCPHYRHQVEPTDDKKAQAETWMCTNPNLLPLGATAMGIETVSEARSLQEMVDEIEQFDGTQPLPF